MTLTRRQWFRTVILTPVLAAVAPYLPAPVKKILPFDFDPILVELMRKSMPNLIAYDICGVQPMTGPTGLVFAMKTKRSTGMDILDRDMFISSEEHRLRPEPGMLVD